MPMNQGLIREVVGDLQDRFISPSGDAVMQVKIRSSPDQVCGALEMACRRGFQAGIHDAYLSLRENHPVAALALLETYKMDKNGTLQYEINDGGSDNDQQG